MINKLFTKYYYLLIIKVWTNIKGQTDKGRLRLRCVLYFHS